MMTGKSCSTHSSCVKNMKHRLYLLMDQDRQRITGVLIAELMADPTVAFAYLFGSMLEVDTVHNVDVGIYLDPFEATQQAEIAASLAQRLADAAGLPADVRVLNQAPVTFLYRALRGHLLVSNNDDLLNSTLEYVSRRYLDMAPFLLQATKEAFAA
jgi:predicted nucleotidyltransferase